MFKKLCLSVFIILFSFNLQAVSAQEESAADVQAGEITTEDLGIKNPGLLPTSPFYFFKELGRGIRSFFTFDPVKKAEVELEIVNEKAAELKKLEETIPENTQALERAVQNYQVNTERLRTRLENLKETSENPQIDSFLDSLTGRVFQHQQLFEELKQKQTGLRSAIEKGQENLDLIIEKVSETLDAPEKFRERLENTVKAQKENAMKEVKALGIMERIEANVAEQAREKIGQIKEDLISGFEGKIKAGEIQLEKLPELFEQIKSQATNKIGVIEEMRERIEDSEIKSKLNVIRQDVLEIAERGKMLNENEVRVIINVAEEQIRSAEKIVAEATSEVKQSVTVLIDRAKVHLEQARKYLETGDLGSAFGQATSASNISGNAYTQAVKYYNYSKQGSEKLEKIGGMEEAVLLLKTEYDKLLSEFQKITEEEKEKYAETYSKLRSFFSECEQMIVRFSSLISKIKEKGDFNIDETKTAEDLYRQIKTSLSSIRSLLGMIPQKTEESKIIIPKEKIEPEEGKVITPISPAKPEPVPANILEQKTTESKPSILDRLNIFKK